jgi:formate dehydrogenase maturation protein FdhE
MALVPADAGRAGSRHDAAQWPRRAARAEQLTASHPAAAEALRFYAALAAVQASLLDTGPLILRPAERFAEALDAEAAVAVVPTLLEALLPIAPPTLARAAEDMRHEDPSLWREAIVRWWQSTGSDAVPDPTIAPRAALRDVVVEALLQPFAEVAAARVTPPGPTALHECPRCTGTPVVAVLREEGHGAKRSAVCGRCLGEWPTPRIACLACGETVFDALPVYRADELSAARIDACDTCRTYVKTLDLTRDARAIPVVDDIATLALDLWARQQGYRRLRPNALRT